jgi:predicted amidohydrolase YtcJ
VTLRWKTLLGALLTTGLSFTAAHAQNFEAGTGGLNQPADMVLTNAHVYTPEGWASAVAIGKGAILAVGDMAAIQPLVTPQTRVIDLHGQTVLPGLHDMHVHPTGAGQGELQCQLPHGSSPGQIFAILAQCVAGKKPGEWITGRAYEAASFGKTPPNKAMLDKIAPNNPVMFTDISGHSSWVNSAALKIAGITRDTPDPKGGIIERDAKGEPTGVLREYASFAVGAKVPPATHADTVRALQWALNTMLAQGITAFDDALVSSDIAAAYDTLADEGKLKQRVRGCLVAADATLIAQRQLYARERFSPSCIKILLDGVPTDSHTAAMLDPYEPMPGRSDAGREKGILQVPPQDLNAMLVHFDSIGMTVKMHAAGDAAVREGLDAIEAARKAHGFSGILHDVGHNSFVAMSDIKRARDLGAVFEFSPYIWFRSPIIEDIEKAIGPERMKRWIPIKDAIDAGAFVVPGSDWAVVPTVNPWIAIETLVTRKQPGGIGEPLGGEEAITLKQAVDMFTINSARQQYASDRLGTIERGKLADLVVIDRNIFEVPITTVHDTKVEMTIINGEIVYDSAHPFPAKP